ADPPCRSTSPSHQRKFATIFRCFLPGRTISTVSAISKDRALEIVLASPRRRRSRVSFKPGRRQPGSSALYLQLLQVRPHLGGRLIALVAVLFQSFTRESAAR